MNPLRLVALGGLGEIGLNAMLLEYGEQALMVDAGVMFSEGGAPGLELIVPDLAYLAASRRKLVAIVLTHGHDDHIGALPHILRRFPAPVYGTEFTLALARRRLREDGVEADLREIAPRRQFTVGPFAIEPVRVAHSTPDSIALAIDTPAGLIVHSGDFKIDTASSDGERFDYDRFAELGQRGVTMLLSDSTNAERQGRTPPESSLRPMLREVISGARGRFFLSSFSSHLYRIRQVAEVSHEFGRRVVPLGRRMVDSVRLGLELGYMGLPPGTFIDKATADSIAADRLTFIVAGSQGEPLSALVKLATDNHQWARVAPGDTVMLSARAIPGNERRIHTALNHLCKRGAEVLHEAVAPVHVSGHASRDELAELINLTRPRYFIPIHGEYRHLVRHRALAIETGMVERDCFLLEDGQTLELSAAGARRGAPVEAGRMRAADAGPEDFELMRERQALARDGTVMVVLTISRTTGKIVAGPDLISRGFVSGDGTSAQMARARTELRTILEQSQSEPGWRDGRLNEQLIRALSRYFRDEMGRRPMVVPCVMEV
ncbi:MAG: ribonuclease J [Candidatus Binataceae bacterium]|jgi:ribonuclease J